MKKFKFQLEKLLTYKNQILEREMLVLAELNVQLSEIRWEIKNIEDSIKTAEAKFKEDAADKATPTTYRIYSAYIHDLNEQKKLKESIKRHIHEEIERQMDVIRNAKVESKSLERLKETRWDDYKKEDAKNEERQIEEFVSTAGIIAAISE